MWPLNLNTYTWQGRFRDKVSEAAFEAERGPEQARRMRFVCVITGCAYLGAGVGDYFFAGWRQECMIMIALRLLAFSVAMGNIWVASDQRRYGWLAYTMAMYMLLLGIAEAYELTWKWQADGMPSASITVFIVLTFYLFLPVRLAPSAAAAVAVSALYVATGILATTMPTDYVVVLFISFVLANGFGMYYVFSAGRSQRLEFKILREERSLNEQLRQEIEHRLRVEKKLRLLANTDELTGLSNRRHFMRKANRELVRAHRHNRPLAILMIDVDHFKEVNDNYGHKAGDLVLKNLARACKSKLRENDLLGRLGGEEFAAVLVESSWSQALATAERLRETAANQKVPWLNEELSVTISVGVATLDRWTQDLETLLKEADQALYKAKMSGRNLVHQEGPSQNRENWERVQAWA